MNPPVFGPTVLPPGRRHEDLLRFARSEFGDTGTEWLIPNGTRAPRSRGFLRVFAGRATPSAELRRTDAAHAPTTSDCGAPLAHPVASCVE